MLISMCCRWRSSDIESTQCAQQYSSSKSFNMVCFRIKNPIRNINTFLVFIDNTYGLAHDGDGDDDTWLCLISYHAFIKIVCLRLFDSFYSTLYCVQLRHAIRTRAELFRKSGEILHLFSHFRTYAFSLSLARTYMSPTTASNIRTNEAYVAVLYNHRHIVPPRKIHRAR